MSDTSPVSEVVMAGAGFVRFLRPLLIAALVALLAYCGGGGAPAAPEPAAYFSDGVEYAFSYELDAQGRVDSYQITQREGIAYPYPAASDSNVMGCSGSLSGSYTCSRNPSAYYGYMSGSGGRLTKAGIQGIMPGREETYRYEQQRLIEHKDHSIWKLKWTDVSTTLSYDASGHLTQVSSSEWTHDYGRCMTILSSSQITLDSQWRLSREEGTQEVSLSDLTDYSTPGPTSCDCSPQSPENCRFIHSAGGQGSGPTRPLVSSN